MGRQQQTSSSQRNNTAPQAWSTLQTKCGDHWQRPLPWQLQWTATTIDGNLVAAILAFLASSCFSSLVQCTRIIARPSVRQSFQSLYLSLASQLHTKLHYCHFFFFDLHDHKSHCWSEYCLFIIIYHLQIILCLQNTCCHCSSFFRLIWHHCLFQIDQWPFGANR